MSSRGCFISLEGGEGVGKSTQLRALAGALRNRGLNVLETREPGGSEGAARLHLARTAVRRAERAMTALAAAEPVNPAALAYANRLSDYLFVLARALNDGGAGDVKWIPGASRGL